MKRYPFPTSPLPNYIFLHLFLLARPTPSQFLSRRERAGPYHQHEPLLEENDPGGQGWHPAAAAQARGQTQAQKTGAGTGFEGGRTTRFQEEMDAGPGLAAPIFRAGRAGALGDADRRPAPRGPGRNCLPASPPGARRVGPRATLPTLVKGPRFGTVPDESSKFPGWHWGLKQTRYTGTWKMVKS